MVVRGIDTGIRIGSDLGPVPGPRDATLHHAETGKKLYWNATTDLADFNGVDTVFSGRL